MTVLFSSVHNCIMLNEVLSIYVKLLDTVTNSILLLISVSTWHCNNKTLCIHFFFLLDEEL